MRSMLTKKVDYAASGMLLNFDVLLEITAVLWEMNRYEEVHSMMKTCMALYGRCLPYLFRERLPIGNKHLPSFCDFMVRDLTRCLYLEWAKFDLSALPEPYASQFVTIIEHATKLTDLTINGSLLDLDDRVCDVLAASSSLLDLEITGVCENHTLFSRMRSPIVNVKISRLGKTSLGNDFVQALSGINATLDDLCIRDAWWGAESNVVYPKVQYLTILNPTVFSIGSLATAFPNLKGLIIENRDPDLLPADYDSTREANITAQNERGTFPELNVIAGQLDALYLLGLTCTVQNLHINSLGPVDDDEDIEMLSAIVDATRPSHLYLTLRSLSLVTMKAALSQVPWGTIQNLCLDITAVRGYYIWPAADAINTVLQSTHLLGGLEELQVAYTWESRDSKPRYSSWDFDLDEYSSEDVTEAEVLLRDDEADTDQELHEDSDNVTDPTTSETAYHPNLAYFRSYNWANFASTMFSQCASLKVLRVDMKLHRTYCAPISSRKWLRGGVEGSMIDVTNVPPDQVNKLLVGLAKIWENEGFGDSD